ncbi:glycerol-3-phosphate 1-O-acyltransferase PlsY [Salinibacillus aidingensis]|uniref:Glycerol-3-phosphate acyltransferase n=1 Tax=Salinibacillus aidingensis TaxID=237684 RepID=A0ABN1BC15_9BACI
MVYVLTSILTGYVFGCIQPSYFIGKWKKRNIKDVGSKNAGASNVTMTFGWKYGSLVALIDILKPVLSVMTITFLFNGTLQGDFEHFIYYLNGVFVILGHNFPFFMNFKGGKGTASIIGLFLIIDWQFGLLGLFLFIVFTIFTSYIVIGAMALYTFFIISTYLLDFGALALLSAAFLTLLAVLMHRENFSRIIKGEEKKLKDAFQKNREMTG